MSDLLSIISLNISYIGIGSVIFHSSASIGIMDKIFTSWVKGIYINLICLYTFSFIGLFWPAFGVLSILGIVLFFKSAYDDFTIAFLKNRTIFFFIGLTLLSLFLLSIYMSNSTVHPIHGVSGMGNWALKAKILYIQPELNDAYFSHATHYAKFSYPPGFALLNSPLFLLKGVFHDSILKLQSIFLLSALFIYIASLFFKYWKWYSIAPIVLLLGFFLGDSAWTVTYWLYSEPLLLLCSAVSLVCLIKEDFKTSLISAGASSLIKNEGVLFFLMVAVLCIILSTHKKHFITFAILCFVPYLSWRFLTLYNGINDTEFDFTIRNFSSQNFLHAYNSVFECATSRWVSYSGMITILPFILIYCAITKKYLAFFSLFIALSLIICYALAISFSSVQDIHWHLSATTRYMMLPTVLTAISLSILPFDANLSKNENN